MAEEKKEFFEGLTKISEDIYSALAAIKAKEVRGIAGMSSTIGDGIASLVGIKNDDEGVHIDLSDEGRLTVDLYVIVHYGYRIPDLALRLQEHVKSGIEEDTETPVDGVNVFIQGIIFEDEVVTATGGAKEVHHGEGSNE